MNENNQRKSGAVLSYVSIIVNTLIQFLYIPILIRMLGQSEYGLYSLVSSVIGYLTVLDLGFGNAIIVYTAKYRAINDKEKEKKLHGMFLMIYYIIAVISAIVGIIIYFNIGNIFANSLTSVEIEKMKIMMLILTFNLFITFSFSIYSSIITAHEKFVFQKIMSIISSILKPCLMIPLLLIGFKSIALTIVITIVNLMVLLSNYFYTKNKLKYSVKFYGFDKNIFKEIISYSFFIFLCSIVDQVNQNVDQIILGTMAGSSAVSIYSIAMQIYLMFIQLSTAISGVFLPKVTKMVAKKVTNDELTSEFIKVGRIQFYIIFLVCSGFLLVGKEFILWWAGSGFEESYYVTLLLIIPAAIPLIQNIGLNIIQAMNKYKFKAITTFIMAIFNIIISIFLVDKYGATGAAFGTFIALMICNVILINIYYLKVIKLNIIKFWRNISKMILCFIIPFAVVLIFIKLTNLSGIFSVMVYGTLYVILYCFVAYFIVMNEYEKGICNLFLKKLKLIK